MLAEALETIARGDALTTERAEAVMKEVLEGRATPAQIGALLLGLRVRGESTGEILGFARALRAHARSVPLPPPLLDTCGTGGDGQGTWNVSTAAALIAAAHSACVAKHGNRASSSRSGSADVLEAMGVRIDVAPDEAPRWMERARFVFLMAPAYHPAMRHAAPVRRELGVRTVMNLLGPLANPARATHQLMGVFERRWIEPVARILADLGVTRGLVVHGEDGLDEISISAPTQGFRIHDGALAPIVIHPEDAGIARRPPGSLGGGAPGDNARALAETLQGAAGPLRDAAILNAGAALWIWGAASDLREGATLARETIDDGRAVRHLALLQELSAEVRPT